MKELIKELKQIEKDFYSGVYSNHEYHALLLTINQVLINKKFV